MSANIFLFIVAYLLFSASGFWAILKFFTMPHWDDYQKAYTDGFDVSWCEIFLLAIGSLVPLFNVSMNSFWLWVLRQQIKRRPLINWPLITMPKCKLPKCPIAVRGQKVGRV